MKISVYITSYNQKAFLIEAIQSVLNQTLLPSQIIIVDDCSQDGSQEVIASYASRYPDLITAVYHTYNQGIAQTRIDALRAVTGDYITYVDGDDRCLPTKLEKEASLLRENPNTQIAFSNYYYMTKDGIRTGLWADGVMPPQGNIFRQTFARDFPRRSLFRMELVQYQAWKRVDFHDPRLRLYEDYDMRIRLTKHNRAVYYDEPLSEIRIHNMGLSSAKAIQHLTAVEDINRKNMHLLDDLSGAERKDIERKLSEWIARIVRRAAREAISDGPHQGGGRVRALKYYIQSMKYQPTYLDHQLLLQILLPRSVYRGLRVTSHRV